ncbi:hypothetical protein J6590_085706 [Homalodisca vitripennis]|nr:hypothetical protein J6590_085706 [Homalodisca vitripennis]
MWFANRQCTSTDDCRPSLYLSTAPLADRYTRSATPCRQATDERRVSWQMKRTTMKLQKSVNIFEILFDTERNFSN